MKNYRLIHIVKWEIKGFEHYGFLEDHRLFNYKTNRFSKKVVRNYSVGFNLDGKFYTLNTLINHKMVIPVGNFSKNNQKIVQLKVNNLIMALAS